MIDNTAIDWKKNMREEVKKEMQEELKKEMQEELKKKNMQEKICIELKNEGKREVALAMLHKGFSPEVIGEITKLPLAEIEKLQAQRV